MTQDTADQYAAELETLQIERPRGKTPKGVFIHTTGRAKEWRSTVLRGNWPLYISPTETTPGKAYEHAQQFLDLLRKDDE